MLALAGEGEAGLCHGEVSHDFTGSPEYQIAVYAPPPEPPPPVGPRLTATDGPEAIVVDGAGFTASADVEVSFIHGATKTVIRVAADETGAFHTKIVALIPAPEGVSVLAKDSGGALATARFAAFAPDSTATPEP